jgi:hypothetical protein
MNILRRAEVSLMSFLYTNRSVRLAKKRTEYLKRVSFACVLTLVLYQWEYKTERLISTNEELAKPHSFMIDGPDPFHLSEKEWETVHSHYLSFYYR